MAERLVIVHLNVAVACLGACRCDAHHEESLVFAGELQSVEHILPVLFLVEDELVRRRHEERGLWVLLSDEHRSPCHGSQCAPSQRFFQDMLVVQFGQLFIDNRQIRHVCADVDMFRIDELADAIVGLLQESPARAKEVEKLFGLDCAADWPEAAPVATCQDEAILIVCHAISYLSFLMTGRRRFSITL